jgi:hypothetical protein
MKSEKDEKKSRGEKYYHFAFFLLKKYTHFDEIHKKNILFASRFDNKNMYIFFNEGLFA